MTQTHLSCPDNTLGRLRTNQIHQLRSHASFTTSTHYVDVDIDKDNGNVGWDRGACVRCNPVRFETTLNAHRLSETQLTRITSTNPTK